ncbi:MAG: aspartate aminotransferase family protein [Planctomycetales bacterium]
MTTTDEHFAKARQVMPGGVNSSVRVNQALGKPLFAQSARGSRVVDLEGREFIDMCCAHGAALLGHGHPAIDEALRKAMDMGYAAVFETVYHEELARLVCDDIPCAERVRFCSSGSEATLHLIRVCRAYTGRKKIIRVEGHFHGYHEHVYIGGHPPRDYFPKNRAAPYIESPGIPEEFASLIVPIPHNDPEALAQAIERHGRDTALLILEPINWNWGGIRCDPEYLRQVRQMTRDAGIVLFFDEIQSVYKTRGLSAQKDYGVTPDVCTVGKSLGGGLPLSGFCGIAEIMDQFKPVGKVQHSGTFNAHLVPVLAGLAFIRETHQPYFYDTLEKLEQQFHPALDEILRRRNVQFMAPYCGARFSLVTGRTTPAHRYEDLFCHQPQVLLRFIRGCYDRGVYFHDYGGSPTHHGFSVQHTRDDLERVLGVIDDVVGEMQREGAL